MENGYPLSWLVGAFVIGISSVFAVRKAQSLKHEMIKDVDDDDSYASSAFGDSDDSENEGGEQLKMVLVVRQDLGMGKGKIAAQCCHACLGTYEKAGKAALKKWKRYGQAKIAVKCPDEDELLTVAATAKSLNIPYYVVCDAGRTQIAAGSRTVCGVGPAPESIINQVTGHLKLL